MAHPAQRPEIRLYVEGGGDSADGKARLREGFNVFLRDVRAACQLAGIRWTLVCAKSHSDTFKAFRNSVDSYHDAWSGMLIDSDCPRAEGIDDVLKLLHQRGCNVSKLMHSQCHLMVVHMETWLLADPDALARHFGKDFDRRALPGHANLEQIAGADVSEALRRSVRNTKSKEYKKIHDGAKLLQLIDPRLVRRRAASCDRLFTTLLEVVEQLKLGAR